MHSCGFNALKYTMQQNSSLVIAIELVELVFRARKTLLVSTDFMEFDGLFHSVRISKLRIRMAGLSGAFAAINEIFTQIMCNTNIYDAEILTFARECH